MKFLILFLALAFQFNAKADVAVKSNCSAAAEKIALEMYLGTSRVDSRNISSEVQVGFDENSELVFDAKIIEAFSTGHSDIIDTIKYKVIAKGSNETCEILSVTKISN